MRYFGFLLSIPMVLFAYAEDAELSSNEQTAYEENEMFNVDDQISKMVEDFDLSDEDFSLSEENAAVNNENEVTVSEKQRRNSVVQEYEEDNYLEFYPSEEIVPQRSKILQSRPKSVPSRRQQETALQKRAAVKQRRVEQEVVVEQPQAVERVQKKAVAPKTKAKAKAASKKKSAGRTVVQNGQKAKAVEQVPGKMRRRAIAANPTSKNNAMSQKKNKSKARVQKKARSAVKRPSIEVEESDD